MSKEEITVGCHVMVVANLLGLKHKICLRILFSFVLSVLCKHVKEAITIHDTCLFHLQELAPRNHSKFEIE